MFIVKHRKIFYSISVILVIGSMYLIFFLGLKLSIDFTGGSLLDISFDGDKPSTAEVSQVLNNLNFNDASVRPSGEGFIVRLKEISQTQKDSISRRKILSSRKNV